MVPHHFFGMTAFALIGCVSYVAGGCGGTTNTNASPQTSNDGGEEAGMMPTEGGASSSSSGGGHDSGANVEAGAEAGPDGGHTPSSTYPAFPVDTGTIVSNGGSVLSAPNIVTVTWSADTNAATWNTYDDAIGATMYWHTINNEYGVGQATGGSHVSITTAPPTTMADTDLDTLVSTDVGNATFPAYTSNTIYAIYLPSTTSLTMQGQSMDYCAQGVGGYHSTSQTGNYVYAVMLQCSNFTPDIIEQSASHEFNEASTDPLGNGYIGMDAAHQLSYSFLLPPVWEVGDACEGWQWAFYDDDETNFMYGVQRQWSNASAKAGHNPCVPTPGTFYSVTGFPSEQTTINVDLSSLGMGAGPTTAQGYKGTLNKPLTFHVGAFSDAPTNGMWTVTPTIDPQFAFPDMNGNPINNGTATITTDKTSVINGDTITVTVTPTAWGGLPCLYVWFDSALPGAAYHGHYPIVISPN